MADIFISYKAEDRDSVATLANALATQGFSVWWDDHLEAGEAFDSKIREELDSAGLVIVCWSPRSVESDYVLAEALEARAQKKLVPILLEDVRLPVPYNRIQTIKFQDWAGEYQAKPFQDLLRRLKPNIGRRPIDPASRKAGPPSYVGGKRINRLRMLLWVIGVHLAAYLLRDALDLLSPKAREDWGYAGYVLAIVALYAGLISAAVSRLHDLGRTGHWAWLLLIHPFISMYGHEIGLPALGDLGFFTELAIIGAVWSPLLLIPGQWQTNRFGPVPKSGVLANLLLLAATLIGYAATSKSVNDAFRQQFQGPVWRVMSSEFREVTGEGNRVILRRLGTAVIGDRITVWPDGRSWARSTSDLSQKQGDDFSTGYPTEWVVSDSSGQFQWPARRHLGSQRPTEPLSEIEARPIFSERELNATFECTMNAVRFLAVRASDLVGPGPPNVFRPREGQSTRNSEVLILRGDEWAVGDPSTRLPVDPTGRAQIWRPIASGSTDFICLRHVQTAYGPSGGNSFGWACVDELDIRNMQRRRLEVFGRLRSAEFTFGNGPFAGQPIEMDLAGYSEDRPIQPIEAAQSTGSCRQIAQ